MIENHFELNIALDGRHFSRMVFPGSLSENDAKERARLIRNALQQQQKDRYLEKWSFDLTYVDCSGYRKEF
jgi:hypothetical protein